MVILHIPRVYTMRLGGQVVDETEVETLQSQYPSLVIHRVEEDHGPGTKLLGLLSFPEADWQGATIVLVDDDHLYHCCLLEWFEAAMEKNPHLQTASFDVESVGPLRVGKGADGFLLRSDVVLDGFLAYYDQIRDLDYVRYHDDVYLSYFLFLRGIFVHKLHPPPGARVYRQHAHSGVDALMALQGKYSRGELDRRVPQILRDVFQSDQEKWSR
jgi:hypothetical protein